MAEGYRGGPTALRSETVEKPGSKSPRRSSLRLLQDVEEALQYFGVRQWRR